MQRKLVKQGQNALTVTLPSNWLKKNNLSGKDFVEIEEYKGDLVICSSNEKEVRKTRLDIRNLQEGLVFHKIIGAYIDGFDEILIKHSIDFDTEKLNLSSRFIGMVVLNEKEDEILLKNIVGVANDTFISIFRRNCQMLISQARLLKKQIDSEINYKKVKSSERILDSNIFYTLRYITKYEKVENSYKYFLLTSTLESIGDYISEISKYTEKNKISKQDIENIELIIETIENYVVFLFSNNTTKMYDLLNNFKENIHRNSFIGGLSLAIKEGLSNYLGFLPKN